jgi:DNA polymerase-3 subunit epsilon
VQDTIAGLWDGIKRLSGRSIPNDPHLRELFDLCTTQKPDLILQQRVIESRFIVLDTETTGFSAFGRDEIISVAMIELNGLTATGNEFQTLINPRRPIPAESTRIHHITDDMVQQSPFVEDVLPEILEFMNNAVIVGHHINFDFRFLNKSLKQIVGCKLSHHWLDTMLIFMALTGRMGHYTLEEVASSCGVSLHDRHTAPGDALTTAEAFVVMMNHWNDEDLTIGELVKRQYEVGHFE